MLGRAWGKISAVILTAALLAQPVVAQAVTESPGALINAADCNENVLNANDDSSTQSVPLPFGVNFYGTSFQSLWVNNNGNVTFDGPLSAYTPFGLSGTSKQIIAPFFADVDTRGVGSQPVRYGWGDTTYEGHRAFCVNWVNVGYYAGNADKLNSCSWSTGKIHPTRGTSTLSSTTTRSSGRPGTPAAASEVWAGRQRPPASPTAAGRKARPSSWPARWPTVRSLIQARLASPRPAPTAPFPGGTSSASGAATLR